MLVRTIQVNQHEKLDYELRKIATDREAELYVLDLCINTHLNGLLDFSKTETIIEEAYLFSRRALEQGYGCFPLRV